MARRSQRGGMGTCRSCPGRKRLVILAEDGPRSKGGPAGRLDFARGGVENEPVARPLQVTGPGCAMPSAAAGARPLVVGVPNEIKTHESRVALTPVGAEELTRQGNRVLIQAGAGQGSGISDEQYRDCGAEIVAQAADVWGNADLIVKVKEPLEVEWPLMRSGQVVFTYFHFAADEK